MLNEDEITKYLDAFPQPWKDCATIILDEGFRWSDVFFNEDGTGLIQVMAGKSKAARRMLPMTPRVYDLLWNRYESSGRPREGWIFPSSSKCGHYNGDTAKDHHKKALTDSGVSLDFGEKRFVPYTLRHTALTNLGEKVKRQATIHSCSHASPGIVQLRPPNATSIRRPRRSTACSQPFNSR